MSGKSMIRLDHIYKKFYGKKEEVLAVRDVNMEIEKGEIFGIIGFSGAGKSTLVRCINLLEHPTEGAVYFGDTNLMMAGSGELRKIRQRMGMIFQQFNLLEQRNVIENICYPLELARVKKKDRLKRAKELLELVDLTEKEKVYPSQLSGGQKQRVAIARALATSALDPITTRSILELLKKINKSYGVTMIVITHEMKVAEQICDRIAVMSEGEIVESGTVKEIFLNPRSETARKLILPDHQQDEMGNDRKILRIAFDGQSSFDPIVSELAVYCNELINILGANTQNIGGKAYGQILIEQPENEKTCRKIRQFLKEKKIYFEEGENYEPGNDRAAC